MTLIVLGIVGLLFFGFAFLAFAVSIAIGGTVAVRKSMSGRVQFMERKDWKRVRTRLNESHEETQVAVATDHLRGLLADE